MYSIYMLPVSTSPRFYPVSLYDKLFISYRPFLEKCTEWPQNDLEHYKLKCTLHVLFVSLVPKFHSVLLYGQPFLRYMASFLRQVPRAIFEIQAILRQVHWMTSNWPWTLQGQITLSSITTLHESQIPLSFALRPAVFELRPFWDKCTPNDLEHYKVKGTPHICY